MLLAVATATSLLVAGAPPARTLWQEDDTPDCDYDAGVQWTALPLGAHVMPCASSNPFQRWAGGTLRVAAGASVASSIANEGTPGYCLGVEHADPVTMAACGSNGTTGTKFTYNHSSRSLGVAGQNRCLNVNHNTGPDVNFERCPIAGVTPPHVQARRQFDWLPRTSQLRSVFEPTLCLTLNRSKILTFVQPPCRWPSVPPPQPPWSGASALLRGITLLENVTAIPGFGADTWYPSQNRSGALISGYDDGGIGSVVVGSSAPSFMTGTSVVTGAPDFRRLSVEAVGGAIHEDGAPMNGRYTSANVVINGTIWVGTYGLNATSAASECPQNQNQGPCQELGPFVGFRTSTDAGTSWTEPVGEDGTELTVGNPLFETLGQPVKLGAPHVVDHGPENTHSPDGQLYMVGMGCLADRPSSNCTWISGDAIFVTRTKQYSANDPGSLNHASNWEFSCGRACWTDEVAKAKPVLSWMGRVGTVTATWHAEFARYLLTVTTPTVMPSTVGPYDTYVLETPSLTDGPFQLVSYMPRFGQQAYFVSIPSCFFGPPGSKEAVMTFSANFACKTGGCEPNIGGATYGANLLPIRFG